MKIVRNHNFKVNSQNTVKTFKSNGYGKYKFPTYDEVPAGHYFSKIIAVKETITKTGKNAIEVYYKIKNFSTCYQVVNGILPPTTDIPKYYIKQVYPKDTTYYAMFVDSMAEALDIGDGEFTLNDIIGVTEYVNLSYDKYDIGGFSERIPFEVEDFIKLKKDEHDEDVYNEETYDDYHYDDDGYI